MASKVSICNAALSRIGATNIIAVDDTTKEGRQCGYYYDILLRWLLCKYEWNFAMKRAEIAQLSTSPDFEYTYQYQLPSDCLRAVRLYNSDSKYTIEGDKLLIDDENVYLKYIWSVTDTTLFHPCFVKSFYLIMASELAIPIVSDKSLKSEVYQEYRLVISEAYRLNAIEGNEKIDEEIEDSSWQTEGR